MCCPGCEPSVWPVSVTRVWKGSGRLLDIRSTDGAATPTTIRITTIARPLTVRTRRIGRFYQRPTVFETCNFALSGGFYFASTGVTDTATLAIRDDAKA